MSGKWKELCDRYLTHGDEQSFWRSNRLRSPSEPEQGWKLHVAATILSATEVLERLGPFLHAKGVMFKAPRQLRELGQLNSGLYYGYTQVGKAFTVYPSSDHECVELARELHELTAGLPAPSVPFDGQYCPGSLVFYRYGSFKRRNIEDEAGKQLLAITDPDGNLIPDSRESIAPEWAANPFPISDVKKPDPASPLSNSLIVIRALSQRGKGGVYLAADFSGPAQRLCILKEGRKHGEVSFDGHDGHWRVRYEKRVLTALRRRGVPVPEIYSSFKSETNFYLVIEHIEGQSLQSLLRTRKRRLPIVRVLRLSLQVARIVAQLHGNGWVWRDCKPANLILSAGNTLRPIDFEGACKIGARSEFNWGTPTFLPDEFGDAEHESDPSVDLYAVGVVIYHLLTGQFPDKQDPVSIRKLRFRTPQWLCDLVAELMNPVAAERPNAESVIRRLDQGLRLSLRARTAKRRSDLSASQNGSEVKDTIDANRSSYDFSNQLKAESLSPRPM
jgi:class IV lanthipeptide synthase